VQSGGDDTATRLRTVVAKLARRLRATSASSGLTPTGSSVLFTVVRSGPLRLSELAEIEAINPTMLSRVVADLVAGELLQRLPDPDDRRVARVEATPAGVKLRNAIRDERADVLNVRLDELDDEERELLERALPVLERLAERTAGRVA
jgi:DNA-binding MarR family transcriptional regulator